jgi:hypothetical protein
MRRCVCGSLHVRHTRCLWKLEYHREQVQFVQVLESMIGMGIGNHIRQLGPHSLAADFRSQSTTNYIIFGSLLDILLYIEAISTTIVVRQSPSERERERERESERASVYRAANRTVRMTRNGSSRNVR